MNKSFMYRLYPSRAQAIGLQQMLNLHRHLYNAALEHRRWAYKQAGVSVSFYQQHAELKYIRQDDPVYATTNFNSLSATLRRLDRSFQHFFRRVKTGQKAGYPRFKARNRFDSVEYPAIGNGCSLRGTKLYLQHLGLLKLKLHRPIEGQIKTLTIKRRADGWYAVFSCDLGKQVVEPSSKPAIGIDLGLHNFLATSEGETVAAPRYYRTAQQKLRRAQRHVARCQRGSQRRRKAVQRVARQHLHVANSRKDFQHKTANSLVARYGVIAVEQLNIGGMSRGFLAKSVHDAGWGQFRTILSHKAAEAGVSVVDVNPHNTSQVCSGCGVLVPKALNVRVHRCTACGLTIDRDVNAALNIKRLGLSRQTVTPTLVGVA